MTLDSLIDRSLWAAKWAILGALALVLGLALLVAVGVALLLVAGEIAAFTGWSGPTVALAIIVVLAFLAVWSVAISMKGGNA